MAFSKSYGPLQISESGGNFSLSIDAQAQVGGGSVAGVITASGQGSVSVKAPILMDAGLAALAAKFPAASAEIKMLQALVDAELANL